MPQHGIGLVQISVEGAVTAVKHIADSHDATGLNTGRAEVLYGTHNGILGQLFLDHMTVKNGWKMKSTSHKGESADCSLNVFQVSSPCFLGFIAWQQSAMQAASIHQKFPEVQAAPKLPHNLECAITSCACKQRANQCLMPFLQCHCCYTAF